MNQIASSSPQQSQVFAQANQQVPQSPSGSSWSSFPSPSQTKDTTGRAVVRRMLADTRLTIGYEHKIRHLHDQLSTIVDPRTASGTSSDPVLTCVLAELDKTDVDSPTLNQAYNQLIQQMENYQAVLGNLLPSQLVELAGNARREKAFNEGTNQSLYEDFAEYLFRVSNTSKTGFFPTGIEPVDQALGGGIHGLTLVLGDRGIGKTSFLINCCVESLACDPTSAVMFYSFDISKRRIIDRIASRLLRVPVSELRRPHVAATTMQRLETEIPPSLLQRINIRERVYATTHDHLFENQEQAGVEVHSVLADVRSRHQASGVQRVLVVVDLFQKVLVPGRIQVSEEDQYRLDVIDQVKQHVDRNYGEGSIAFLVACEMRKRDGVRSSTLPTREDIKGDSRIASDADNILILGNERKIGDICEQTLRIDKGREGVTRGDHGLRFFHQIGKYEPRKLVIDEASTTREPVESSIKPFA